MQRNGSFIMGDHTFAESGEFDVLVGGNATVAQDVELTLKGMVGGNLVVETGAVVRLEAMIAGDTINRGGSIISGV
ncbi:hypothetical protein [Pseudoruegeria sp. HB172150]|uniref:hypothetical protein n=1 Tax=Pseudoruegeria sp. HB172150 TaxID=2721164 RepID=UPI001557D1F2|nr:hypothetical protein [Pseudoruegeria sp. HB172150]